MAEQEENGYLQQEDTSTTFTQTPPPPINTETTLQYAKTDTTLQYDSVDIPQEDTETTLQYDSVDIPQENTDTTLQQSQSTTDTTLQVDTENTDTELVFSRVSSSTTPQPSNEQFTPGLTVPNTTLASETSLISEVTDLHLMSVDEIDDWDNRMAQMLKSCQQHQQHHELWQTDLQRRRLTAFARLKNLNRLSKNRMTMYGSVEKYIDDIKLLLNNTTDSEKSLHL